MGRGGDYWVGLKSLVGVTTAILVMGLFLMMCVLSFIGGWFSR